MTLDSGQLELLAALTRHKTLAAASASIHLSPSAASRRLHEAERRLGFTLALVDGRSMSLTPAGRIIAEAAVLTENQLSEAELAARWLGSGTERPLRIGVGFFDSINWTLPSLGDHRFEIIRIGQASSERALQHNEVDIVIDVHSPTNTAGTTLAYDRLTLVVSPQHPLAKNELVSATDVSPFRYLGSSLDPQPGFEFDAFFRPANDCPTDISTVESLQCLLDIVATGDAVSIQPSQVVPKHRTDLCCVDLANDVPVVWVALTGHAPTTAAQAFITARK